MKRLFTILILAMFPVGLWASPVTSNQVCRVARNWVKRGKLLGAYLGSQVEHLRTHQTRRGTTYYSVQMQGGGTIIMAGDTEIAPVIAFSNESTNLDTLDPASPLACLLETDLTERSERISTPLRLAFAASASTLQAKSAAAQLWAELDTEPLPNLKFASAITYTAGIGDMRVAPLVKSKWSQSTASNKACYNYYTPNGSNPANFVPGDPGNAVCGCVATAISQIMRYHCYPTNAVTPVTHECFWTDSLGTITTMDLTMQGGTYAWDQMPLVPNTASMQTANYQAIGKLTADVGIAVYMQYTSKSSGAYSVDAVGAFKQVFGYKSAAIVATDGVDANGTEATRQHMLQHTMFSNFDAGYPVCVGIPGHQIIADGYGYNNGVDYVHLNMGWAGSCDYWYNLPDMTIASSKYSAVEDVCYNIFPDKDGTYAVIAGRVLDERQNPVANATVTIKNWYGATVANLQSNDKGIWAAQVTSGNYTVTASTNNGRFQGTLNGIRVNSPVISVHYYSGITRGFEEVVYLDEAGNSWGNEVVLVDTAKIMVGGVEYASLAAAVTAANSLTPIVCPDVPTVDNSSHTITTAKGEVAQVPTYYNLRVEDTTVYLTLNDTVAAKLIPFTKVRHQGGQTLVVACAAQSEDGNGNIVYSFLTTAGFSYALAVGGEVKTAWVAGDGAPQQLSAPVLSDVSYSIVVRESSLCPTSGE